MLGSMQTYLHVTVIIKKIISSIKPQTLGWLPALFLADSKKGWKSQAPNLTFKK